MENSLKHMTMNDKVLDSNSKCSVLANIYEASSPLSFDKKVFLEDNFSVENFVKLQQSVNSGNLENLRDDLGIYLKILRSAMIELINRDYADFVNLSTNLTGLDRLIDTLKPPLEQLREEVEVVNKLLNDAILSATNDVDEKKKIKKQKNIVWNLTEISVRLDALEALLSNYQQNVSPTEHQSTYQAIQSNEDLLDHLAAEVNHLNFLVAQCEGVKLLESFKPRLDKVSSFVQAALERGLREGLMKKDKLILSRVLRTYADLSNVSCVHDLVRNICKEKLDEIISTSNLNADPRGLQGMYSNISSAVMAICNPLLTVIDEHESSIYKDYKFISYSVWPEVVSALEMKVDHIFNPGNPAVFFQEISQVVESSLFEDEDQLFVNVSSVEKLTNTKDGFFFSSSQTVLDNLKKCYDQEIFLFPLVHRFWKLTLLILSRHRTWLSYMQSKMKAKMEKLKLTEEKLSPRLLQFSYMAAFFIFDIECLSQKIPEIIPASLMVTIKQVSDDMLKLIKETLEDQKAKLRALKVQFGSLVEYGLSSLVIAQLKQVVDTPRLYRRTNRDVPTTSQQYVCSAVVFIRSFVETTHVLSPKLLELPFRNSCTAIFEEYAKLVYDVLTTVYKMEASLKKLKRARDHRGGSQDSEQDTRLTDDDKIRVQIYLDVEDFGKQGAYFSIKLRVEDPPWLTNAVWER